MWKQYLTCGTDFLRTHFTCFIKSAETSFNQYISHVDFFAFCLIYTIILIYILRKVYKRSHAIFKPQSNEPLDWKTRIKKKITRFFVGLPIIKQLTAKEFNKGIIKLENEIHDDYEKGRDSRKANSLPYEGMSEKNIKDRMKEYYEKELKVMQSGKVSGAVYVDDEEHYQKVNDFAAKYLYHNPLHLDTFKELMTIQAELMKMTGCLVSKKKEFFGILTSGGSQSLIMSLYAYKKFYSSRKRPNIVAPNTVHAAVEKGCFYFNIELRKCDIDPKTYQANMSHLKSLIDSNTILIIGSYPNYPHGIIDPIQEMAALAKKKDVGFHIDGCLGGFVAAFLKDHESTFNLDLDGVTSISIDHHKFGLAPKGISAIIYKTNQLRHCMYYSNSQWVGGVYATPSFNGSRAGFASAGAWIAMLNVNKRGYIDNAKAIQNATKVCAKKLNKIKGVQVFGDPQLCVLAFKTVEASVFRVAAYLQKQKGWHISPIHLPDGIHLSVTLANYQNVMNVLPEHVEEAIQHILKHPQVKTSNLAAIYGASSTMPSDDMGEEMLKSILSATLKF